MNIEELIRVNCEELKNILIEKNKEYGNSAFNTPILCPNIKPEEVILTRLSEKIDRLKNILQSNNGDKRDTVLDIAGYCVLLLSHWDKETSEQSPIESSIPEKKSVKKQLKKSIKQKRNKK